MPQAPMQRTSSRENWPSVVVSRINAQLFLQHLQHGLRAVNITGGSHADRYPIPARHLHGEIGIEADNAVDIGKRLPAGAATNRLHLFRQKSEDFLGFVKGFNQQQMILFGVIGNPQSP